MGVFIYVFTMMFAVGVISMLFISPIIMNYGLIKISRSNSIVEVKDKIICAIPIVNHFYGWKIYGGSVISLSGIGSLSLFIGIISRIVVMFFMFENADAQVISIWVFLISFVIYWVLSAVDIFRILGDSGLYTFSGKFLNAAAIILGQVNIGAFLPKKISYYEKKKKNGLYE